MPKILCGEDDQYVLQLLKGLLRQRGYDVITATDGVEVLEAVDAAVPDLILLDIVMPRMTGLQVLTEFRKRPAMASVPVIVISGMGDERTITQALNNGAQDYIVKPFTTDEVIAKVAVSLRRAQSQAAPDGQLGPGTTFAQHFRIVKKIQSGGFSTVFLAEDTDTTPPKHIALKVFDLPRSKRADRAFISGFLREAYQISRLDHPCIVTFYEFGQSGPHYFLAMEYLRGKSIDKLVSEHGPLLVSDVIYIGHEVARAIKYLGEQELVHRDIKPPNIIITLDRGVKLLDFGLAKNRLEDTVTLGGEFKGTPSFVSPEYIEGNVPVSIQSDIYSLGATLYYAATSVILFAGRTPHEILRSHQTMEPPPLEEFDPDVPSEFSRLIAAMLTKKPDDRPHIDEIITTLAKLSDRRVSGKAGAMP